ncbi:hypothetical protein DdX_15454 [Ditylenchus destructor]|uniref:Uncharacterized protein n=1 Tax=Ditylenchus destructor TaxID=166010 RepID=A0AAD4QXN6_9BILA|nr:hypothetical protein DdX_15454 [Ditylenchus destructor]
MKFVTYSVILVIHSLSQYTVTAPAHEEKQNVFQVQGIIGCLTGENGTKSEIPASVEFYAKSTEAGKADKLIDTLKIDNINSILNPQLVQHLGEIKAGARIMFAKYDDGEQNNANSETKQPPPGSFAIRGFWPDACPACEKGAYLKLAHNCPSDDNKDPNLVYMESTKHPIIRIEIPTKFIAVRKTTDVTAVPKIFDIGKISW